jgi:methylenetetrahydrofolate dehydrogenase (NADP+)/methenyltetrahydrofolate cyclohydrolase
LLIIDGKRVSQEHRERLKARIEKFVGRTQRRPGLAVVLVGDNPASAVYVKNKIKACEQVGITSIEVRKPATTDERELLGEIDKLNRDPRIDGILVQLPLPKPLNSEPILRRLDVSKDVDALTTHSQGLLFAGRPLAVPCTPAGVMAMLHDYKIPVRGRHAVVIGRSAIVGKPMAQMLLQADATVTQCHSLTPDLRVFTRMADIVVVAAGKPEFLGREDFKKGAVVIDVGIHRQPKPDGSNHLVGDVRFEELKGWVAAATPVPGGVGPMTITTLLENTLTLAEARQNKAD